ncbi:hypothetical protein HK102_011109, partial [Quaeritorhiza haematococci]
IGFTNGTIRILNATTLENHPTATKFSPFVVSKHSITHVCFSPLIPSPTTSTTTSSSNQQTQQGAAGQQGGGSQQINLKTTVSNMTTYWEYLAASDADHAVILFRKEVWVGGARNKGPAPTAAGGAGRGGGGGDVG